MFYNYFKIAIRSVLKDRLFTALNVIGLSLGVAASILILLNAKHEYSYDDFHEDSESLYRVQYDAYHEGKLLFKSATAFPLLADVLKDEFPEVEETTRLFLSYGGSTVRTSENTVRAEHVFFAEPSFFELFSFPVIKGSAKALAESKMAIISEKMAETLFGTSDAIGKKIIVDRAIEVEVGGVAKNAENSHFKFDVLVSYPTGVNIWGQDFTDSFGWYYFYVYLRLNEGADPESVESKFPALVEKYGGEDGLKSTSLSLQSVQDIHLHSDLLHEVKPNGDVLNSSLMLIAGIAILFIAWLNYVNLSISKRLSRAHEAGVRKVLGAGRIQLMKQFVLESFIFSFLAIALAVLLVDLSLPVFNSLSNQQLEFSIPENTVFIAGFFIVVVVGTLISGIYPGILLSRFSITDVFKGSANNFRGLFIRRLFVVLQFTISSILIAGTLIIYQQMDFIRTKDLGVDVDNTLIISAPVVTESDSSYQAGLSGFKNAVNGLASVKGVSTSSEIPGGIVHYWAQPAVNPKTRQSARLYVVDVDPGYLNAYKHRLVAGRYFSDNVDESQKLVLTKKAAAVYGFSSPEAAIGQEIYIEDYDTCTVIGVVEDYHQQGLQEGYFPVAFYCDPDFHLFYSIKVDPGQVHGTIAGIHEAYKEFFPENPFNYFFLDSYYNRQYQSDTAFGRIFLIFSVLTIVVACMGLFGLSFFTVSRKTKEIGIRKVLGADSFIIFSWLSKEFLSFIIIANGIALPVVWFVMNRWLENFAFHIEISTTTFLMVVLLTLFIALITVSYHVVKASNENPVSSLKSD